MQEREKERETSMKKTLFTKRLLCGALAAAVVFSCFPAGSAAAEESRTTDQSSSELLITRENERKTLDFNTDWLFIRGNDLSAKEPDYDESSAEHVSLPHARDTYDLFEPDLDSIQTIDWYRRHFTLPAADSNDRVFVEFNGGGQINRVYVNGALVGEAKGTFTHFKFDITDYVTFGNYDNVIAVQVDSQYHSDEMPPGNSIDFHYFGGLHGEASMTLTDNLYSESVFYYNDDVEYSDAAAILNGKIEITNRYSATQTATVRSVIKDNAGNEVSTTETTVDVDSLSTVLAQLEHTIDAPNLWSPDNPYLYTAETYIYSGDICIDQVSTTIGIRTLTATAMTETEGYFMLNGERITVFGGNWHMQAPYLGNSRTAKLNEKDAETLKYDLGINFVRTSHYQADPSFLDACDRLGIMVEEEPLGWNDTPGWEQFCYSMEEMIKRDRNHASIVLWGIIPNERPLNYPSVEESRERQTVAKELDPSRLTIQEDMNNATPVADVYGWHDYVDPNSGSIKNNPNAKSWFVTEWNTNLGKYFVIPGDSETRKTAQIVNDGKKMGQLMSDSRVMGTLKWDLFGYYTPQSAYEKGKNVDLWRSSGVYGIWRDPLHKTWIAYLMAAQAPNEEDTGEILKIASEWKSDSSDTIRVITNLDEVELLYDNGSGTLEQVGYLNSANEYGDMLKNGMFAFTDTNLEWSENSRLVARGYRSGSSEAAAEDIVYASTYETEKDRAALELHNTIGDIEADGADVAWILAELKDKNGQREFYGAETVTAEILSGPGTLVYSGEHPTMADGISGFYLRSEQDKPGTTEIQVSADLGEDIDDSNIEKIEYSGSGWTTVNNRADSYQNTLHQTSTSGDSVTISFTGNRIIVYSESSNTNGSGTVTLDGRAAGTFSCSNTAKYGTIGNQAVYESPVLENTTHTLTLTASNGTINIDRIKIFDGVDDVTATLEVNTVASDADRVPCDPSLPDAEMPETGSTETLALLLKDAEAVNRAGYTASSLAALDDAVDFATSVMEMETPVNSIVNKAVSQLQNALSSLVEQPVTTICHTDTVMEGQSGGVAYVSSNNAWVTGANNTYANKSRTVNDYYTITFTGIKIELYSMLDNAHGLAAVSIDDGEEVKVDQYSASQVTDVLFWESDILDYGSHTVKVRVTGETSGNANNACISFGYAQIYESMDETLTLQEQLAGLIEEAGTIDRTAYTTDSLNTMDAALLAAGSTLRSPELTAAELNSAIKALQDAIAGLSGAEAPSVTTITCRDEDMTATEGEPGKIYYSSANTDDWVLENADSEELMNRYLKKAATGQENAYASLKFEGTGVSLHSRFSATSGKAKVVLSTADGNVVDEAEFSLYDSSVTARVPGTRQAYTISGLDYGTYVLKLIPLNQSDEANSDNSLTSINLAKVEVTTSASGSTAPDTGGLNALIGTLNGASLEGKHAQTKASFEVAVRSAVRNSYGLLTGTFPAITLAEELPEGTTEARIAQVMQELNEALNILDQPLTIREVKSLADITVAQGTDSANIPFPGQVMITSSDAQSERISISYWTCETFDPEAPGEYIFTGQLVLPEGMENPDGLAPLVKVTVTAAPVESYAITLNITGANLEDGIDIAVPSQASEGSPVSVSINSLAGYSLESIQATYTPAGEAAEQALGLTETEAEKTYTFTMPSGPVTITVSLKAADTPVAPESPAVESVTITSETSGLTGGISEIKVGGQITLSAKVTPANASYTAVDWTLTGDAAQLTTSGNNAIVTGIKEGTVTVTASINGVVSSPITLTVAPADNMSNPPGGASGGTGAAGSSGTPNTSGPSGTSGDTPPNTGDSPAAGVFGMTAALVLATCGIVLCAVKRKRKSC